VGFRVTGLAARVLWNQPEDAITTRNHMLLRVELDGVAYIADVGFGGLALTSPLRLEPDIEQETPHAPFRLLRKNGDYQVQARIGTGWKTLYRFDLQEQFLPDYAVSSHYLATHPDSHFLAGLIAARPDGGQRYALRNNQLAIHHLDGRTERRTLAGAEEIRTVLERDFRLPLPGAPELDATLDKLAASGS
jgi:N-hydroxyarylamine O-acetyltransferase